MLTGWRPIVIGTVLAEIFNLLLFNIFFIKPSSNSNGVNVLQELCGANPFLETHQFLKHYNNIKSVYNETCKKCSDHYWLAAYHKFRWRWVESRVDLNS
jgi:hypothetical protein